MASLQLMAFVPTDEASFPLKTWASGVPLPRASDRRMQSQSLGAAAQRAQQLVCLQRVIENQLADVRAPTLTLSTLSRGSASSDPHPDPGCGPGSFPPDSGTG